MRYHRPGDDWVTSLTGSMRADVRETLRGLPLADIQKYPPPKMTGLPVGNEARVLMRYLRGRSSQLDASALSTAYRSFASTRERLLYRAFRQGDWLTADEWTSLLGAGAVARWRRGRLLTALGDRLRLRFAVVALDRLLFVVDPLNDHGGTEESAALPADGAPRPADATPFHHTYIGQDSLRMIEHIEQNPAFGRGRYLDCGIGAGALLLYFGRRFDESIGIDINDRAVRVAAFNAELNVVGDCRTQEADALTLGASLGRFDLVTWNLPFIFMPDAQKDESIDADGGDLGIGLCLAFIDTLPPLLSDHGVASIAALSPVLTSGELPLERRLQTRLLRLGLDCVLTVTQASWAATPELWRFHRSRDIRRFESVYLQLRPGRGVVRRVEASPARRLLDLVRGSLYERRFA